MTQHLNIQDLRDFETLCDWEDAAGTEQRLNQFCQVEKVALNSDPFYHAEVLSQVARAHGIQNKFTEAKLSLDHAEALLKKTEEASQSANDNERENVKVAKIRYLLELGRLLVLEKTPSQARPLFRDAWTAAREIGEDYYAIDAAQMLSTTEPPKMRREWTLKAFEIVESSRHPRAKEMRAAVYTSLGWLDFEMRKFEGALDFFKKALEFTKNDGFSKRKIISAEWAIGRTLRALNRIDEAFQIQSEAVSQLKNMNLTDGLVFEEMAECLHLQKKPNEAQPFFELAYRELVLDQWLADNEQARMKRLKELGKVKDNR